MLFPSVHDIKNVMCIYQIDKQMFSKEPHNPPYIRSNIMYQKEF